MIRPSHLIKAGLGLAAALALSIAPLAHADNGVVLGITGGSRSAVIADLTLVSKPYSHTAQEQTGAMTLSADDSTGLGTGWNVTVQSSQLAYTGTSPNGAAIPASAFLITSAAAPTATAGQAVDATFGPMVPAALANVSLDSSRKVLMAQANYGLGTYSQTINVKVNIPAQARVGTYTGTLTVTINEGPGL